MRARSILLAALLAVASAACADTSAAPTGDRATTPAFAATAVAPTGTPTERAAAFAARINARLAAAGSTKRLVAAYFFTIGHGVDPFRRLRTGARWNAPGQVTYMIDQDFTANFDPAASAGDLAAVVRGSFEKYGQVPRTSLHLTEIPFNGLNNDFLDAIVTDQNNVCIDIVDTSSPSVNSYDPTTGAIDFTPAANDLFGGFIAGKYFSDCLGDPNILAVTWTFSGVDGVLGQGRDGYEDLIYNEMLYNADFAWTLSKAVYLDFNAPTDFESVITHEAGHTFGLDHFGGPNLNQPFKLRPNGRVFDPEAVMNPYYLGGEKRALLPTDIAALRTLYARRTLP